VRAHRLNSGIWALEGESQASDAILLGTKKKYKLKEEEKI
jgi:hypothetical protein